MNSKLKCSACGGTAASVFIILGDKSICTTCAAETKKSGDENKIESSVPTRFFTQYICKTHKCGTCKISQIGRHKMWNCEIIEREIPHWHKPKTFGGHNGDINRRYFVTDVDVKIKLMKNWRDMIVILRKKYKIRVHGGGRYGSTNRRGKTNGYRKQRSNRGR